MPIKSKFTVLGLELTKETPTIEEWSAKWGAESIRTEATNNVWYRSTAPEVRDLFLHGRDEQKDEKGNVLIAARAGVDDLTKIPRNVIQRKLQTKNVDGSDRFTEVWDPADSEQKYFNRVCSELVKQGKFPAASLEDSMIAAKASFSTLLQECTDLVEFDASKAPPAEKKAKSLPQVFIQAAQAAVAKGTAHKLAKLLSKSIGAPVGTTVEGKFAVTVEELAKAMKRDDEILREKRQADLAALVSG